MPRTSRLEQRCDTPASWHSTWPLTWQLPAIQILAGLAKLVMNKLSVRVWLTQATLSTSHRAASRFGQVGNTTPTNSPFPGCGSSYGKKTVSGRLLNRPQATTAPFCFSIAAWSCDPRPRFHKRSARIVSGVEKPSPQCFGSQFWILRLWSHSLNQCRYASVSS